MCQQEMVKQRLRKQKIQEKDESCMYIGIQEYILNFDVYTNKFCLICTVFAILHLHFRIDYN